MIIPVSHIVVANYPVAASTTFEAGNVASLDANGYAVLCDANGSYTQPIGLFADRSRSAEAYEWVNRVSDMGNDTRASGMASVYQSGGIFYVDVNDSRIATPGGTEILGVVTTGLTAPPGTKLYTHTVAGQLHTTQTSSQDAVAIVLESAATLGSGIPGEYEPASADFYSSNTAENPRTWVKIKLLV